jgi:ankyrin repeat protein
MVSKLLACEGINLNVQNKVLLLFLIGLKALIILFSQDGYCALHFACGQGHSEVVGVFLEQLAGIDTFLRNKVGYHDFIKYCSFLVSYQSF